MATKLTSRSAALRPALETPPDIGLTPPWTTPERLVHIEALGKRIDQHIRFICAVDTLHGTSLEAKDKAVAVFYERLRALEQQLDRIHVDLQLG
jgi:hypothetical protein